MKIYYENKEITLPMKIHRYDTFFKRLKGLMFRIRPIKDEGILLKPCNSIHMFFMFFPIDVIFLNEANEVVFVKENVKPWSVIWPVKGAVAAIELPAGAISGTGVDFSS